LESCALLTETETLSSLTTNYQLCYPETVTYPFYRLMQVSGQL